MSRSACQDPCTDAGCDNGCCDACGAAGGVLQAPANRSGRDAVDARLGDYSRFFAQATAALSSGCAALGTRAADDPAIALLDAWAVAADVLAFHRERFTQEGYLRTARSERSLRELAAQVGYLPRPGVAATVPLAYLLDANATPVTIPAGAKCQSVPRPGEQMQTFETAEALEARAEWSRLGPHRTRIPAITRVDALLRAAVMLDGTALGIRPGQRLLFVFAARPGMQVARDVASTRIDTARGVTEVQLKLRTGLDATLAADLLALLDATARDGKSPLTLRAMVSYLLGASASDCASIQISEKEPASAGAGKLFEAIGRQRSATPAVQPPVLVDAVLQALAVPRGSVPLSSRGVQSSVLAGMQGQGAQRGALLRAMSPDLGERLYQAWRGLPASARDPETDSPGIHVLRATHGAYAPVSSGEMRHGELGAWKIDAQDRDLQMLYLDAVNDMIAPGSHVLIEAPISRDQAGARSIAYATVAGSRTVARNSYGVPARVTRIELGPERGDAAGNEDDADGSSIGVRTLGSLVYCVQSEAVTLAGDAIDDDIAGDTVLLDRLYEDLRPGRWIIVSGERTDVALDAGGHVPGLQDAEWVLVAGVDQVVDAASPGAARLTALTLDPPLAYRYRRATAVVYGNVVKASHGETVDEVLGAGDARIGNQAFALKRPPLTWVAAVSTSGVAGTQVVRVNQVRWRQVDSLLDAAPDDRVYQVAATADGVAVLTFGDGVRGARLPSGQDNIRATYRVGLGKPGNVQAGQISLLGTRPLGVQGVVNPLRASGGAGRDGIDSIRRNIPMAVRALSPRSRLVSVDDHAVFARRFAAIGHARAERLLDGGRSWVHVTVAGTDDLPLDPQGALLLALRAAFRRYGDPALPIALDVRERLALLLQARVAIDADADWDVVEPRLRAGLLDAFSPARRALGQAAYASEAIAAMHRVASVAWVDLDVFGALSEAALNDSALLTAQVAALQADGAADRVACLPARLAGPSDKASAGTSSGPSDERMFLPAQMAYLVPGVPAALVLNLVQGARP